MPLVVPGEGGPALGSIVLTLSSAGHVPSCSPVHPLRASSSPSSPLRPSCLPPPPPTRRSLQGTTLHWEKPSTNSNVTHPLSPAEIPAGTRIGLTGRRDTAPNPHAMAMRVDWAAEAAGAAPGPPLLSSTDWEVATVSAAFAATFVDDAPTATAWAPAVDVSAAVSDTAKLFSPAGALHVAAATPGDEDSNAKYWVAFRSPPTPTWGVCTATAAGDGGSTLSTGVSATIGIVAVVLVGAVIAGVVWTLHARQQRRARVADESDAGWPSKPAGGGGGCGGGGDGGDAKGGGAPGGRQEDSVATPAPGTPAYPAGGGAFPTAGAYSPPRGGHTAGGGGAPPSEPFSVATSGSPAVDTWTTCEDIRAQAVAAQALEADVAAAAQALYEDTVAAGERARGLGGAGAPVAAGGAVDISDGGSGEGGGGVAMRVPALTATASSGDMGTLGAGSVLTGSLVSSVELPRVAAPVPRLKRGVALPDDDDDDGLSPPPLPPALWTPIPSPGV